MSATGPPAGPSAGPRVSTLVAVAIASVTLGLAAVAGLGLWIVGPQGNGMLQAVSVDATSTDATEPDGYSVWGVNDDGSPIRWDPCSPVELVVAPGWPPGFLDDLRTAVSRIRAASGLDIDIAGPSDERPSRDRLPYQPERHGERWAPVLVAWAAPGEAGLPLRDIDRGVAIPVAVGSPGDRSYVTGQVVFNRERTELQSGFADRQDAWGATILHELAHVLGLGHVDDPGELMHTFPGSGPATFGPGDLRGLAAVGTDGGCRSVPHARPVVVEPS